MILCGRRIPGLFAFLFLTLLESSQIARGAHEVATKSNDVVEVQVFHVPEVTQMNKSLTPQKLQRVATDKLTI